MAEAFLALPDQVTVFVVVVSIGQIDMKSKRKCNDCGGSLSCYTSVSNDKTKTQFFRCDVCEVRVKITLQVISEKIKRRGEKVFSESTSTTIDVIKSAS